MTQIYRHEVQFSTVQSAERFMENAELPNNVTCDASEGDLVILISAMPLNSHYRQEITEELSHFTDVVNVTFNEE